MTVEELILELNKLSDEDKKKKVVVDCWYEIDEIKEFENQIELIY